MKTKNKTPLEKISYKLFPQLNNLDYKNKDFVIAFSGVPGSGKSYVAKILEDRYRAVRIRSDDIRRIIDRERLTQTSEEREELLQDYIFELIENPPFRNGLLILDKSMDRQYERFFSLCKSRDLDYFIIRMGMPAKNAIEKITKRGKAENMENLSKSMDKWWEDYQDFGRNVRVDVSLDTNNFDLDELFKKLDPLLK